MNKTTMNNTNATLPVPPLNAKGEAILPAGSYDQIFNIALRQLLTKNLITAHAAGKLIQVEHLILDVKQAKGKILAHGPSNPYGGGAANLVGGVYTELQIANASSIPLTIVGTALNGLVFHPENGSTIKSPYQADFDRFPGIQSPKVFPQVVNESIQQLLKNQLITADEAKGINDIEKIIISDTIPFKDQPTYLDKIYIAMATAKNPSPVALAVAGTALQSIWTTPEFNG